MKKYVKVMLITVATVLIATGAYSARRLYTPLLTATRVAGDLTPSTDNAYDLGSATLEWRNLRIDGTAYIDTAEIDTATIGTLSATVDLTSAGHVLPSADDTYDLGAVGSEWRNAYIDGTLFADLIDATAFTALVPLADDTYDLGSAVAEWKDLYIDGIAQVDYLDVDIRVNSALIPGGGYDLGTNAERWDDIYGSTVVATDLNVEDDVLSDLIPDADDTYDLGSATSRWQDGYFDGVVDTDRLVVNNDPAELHGGIDLMTNGIRIDLDTDNDTSIRASIDDEINFEVGGTDRISLNTTMLEPSGNLNLGWIGAQWGDLYLTGTAYIDRLIIEEYFELGFETSTTDWGDGRLLWLNDSGNNAGYVKPLEQDNSDVSTSGTGEDDLQTRTLIAGEMQSDGGIEIFAAGTKTNGSTENKTIKLHFGASSWEVHAAAANTNDWRVEARIVNTATNAQRISWVGYDGTTILQGYETAAVDTTGAVIVKITGEVAGTGTDIITQTMWTVRMY